MTSTTPYYCPLCLNEKGCGYNGLLRFEGAQVPTCNHHTDETNTPDLVKMVPVAERKHANSNAGRT